MPARLIQIIDCRLFAGPHGLGSECLYLVAEKAEARSSDGLLY
jgi:hypothetical protein